MAADMLLRKCADDLLRDGAVHVHGVFKAKQIASAIDAAMASEPTGFESLMNKRYETFLDRSPAWDLLELAPDNFIRCLCSLIAEEDCSSLQSYRSSILEAKVGASQQKFHRDRGMYSTLPRLLYGFASPMKVPLHGATTTVIPGSHLPGSCDSEEWKVCMDEGDLLLFFGHVTHRGDANNADKDRPLLTTLLDVNIPSLG